ncbi:class V chitinase CHIT5b [Elaeis guineensis]|uniref:Nod factor hydrolase protein 1 n=1 Tax=Elaeis guineensis var. tenera TaxID=51953 RepID=A0A6I9SFP1_ELAGV|nr:nod factor hydrolase protein 1 [Elaeis guineensis]
MASEFIAFLILSTSFFLFISRAGAYGLAPAASPSSPTDPFVPFSPTASPSSPTDPFAPFPDGVPTPAPAPVPPPSSAIKAGYWFSGINPTSINLSYFTHIYYAFVELDNTSFEVVITPSDADILADFTATLHAHQPPVKAMLSIGGGGGGGDTFASMATNFSTRSAFIKSTIAVAREYNLDGLDLDWEFPVNPEKMASLGDLFMEWRDAIAREAAETGRPSLLLTSAVYFASHFFLPSYTPRSYPTDKMAVSLDWINAMCYDYHGAWNKTETGAPAALFDPKSNVSTSYGLTSWVEAGIPPKKVVMGLPLYSHTWQLKDPADHGIGAPAVGVGPGNEGVLVYSKVVDFNSENNATQVYDEVTVSVYSYAGTNWIGYDDPLTVTTKIEFAQELGLGGYFFWAIGYDKDWSISQRAWDAWQG